MQPLSEAIPITEATTEPTLDQQTTSTPESIPVTTQETNTSDVQMTDASEAQTVASAENIVPSPDQTMASEDNTVSDIPSSSLALTHQINPPHIITDPDFQSMCDTIYADIKELYEARRNIYHVPSYSEKWKALRKQFEEALENLKEISE